MASDDSGSSSSEEQIQPPLEKKPKLAEQSESESGGDSMNNDDVQKLEGNSGVETVEIDYNGDDDGDGDANVDEDDDFMATDDYREDTESSDDEEDNEDGRSAEEEDEASTDVEAEKLRQHIADDDKAYMAPGDTKVDHKKWVRYWRRLRLSEKFDIKIEDYPGDCYMASVVPVLNFRDYPLTYSKVIKLAKLAIERYNSDKEENYAFKDVVSVNKLLASGIMYYITFEAVNLEANGAVETFQAKVFTGIEEEIVVEFCRRKLASR